MRIVRTTLGLLLAAVCAVSVAAPSAQAATADECQLLLGDLRQETLGAAGSFTDAGTVDRLVVKLDASSTKLAEGKNADAIGKLVGYQTTLNQLATAPKPKVDLAGATTLTTDAQAVIDCIVTLG